jgi:hypothetical protein
VTKTGLEEINALMAMAIGLFASGLLEEMGVAVICKLPFFGLVLLTCFETFYRLARATRRCICSRSSLMAGVVVAVGLLYRLFISASERNSTGLPILLTGNPFLFSKT